MFKRKKPKIEKSYVIFHVAPGSGATHLSLSIANYISSVLGHEVIYIEQAEKSRLIQLVKGKSCNTDEVVLYEYKRVKYAVSATVEETRKILLSAKSHVVVNLEKAEGAEEIIDLCSKVIVLGDYSRWNENSYIDFVSKNIYRKYDINKFLFLGNKGKRRKENFKSIFELEMKKTPYIEDPFYLSHEEIEKIEKIL